MIHALSLVGGEGLFDVFFPPFFVFLDSWLFELFLLAIGETDLGTNDKSLLTDLNQMQRRCYR